jgi:peptidoglycan/LPS O-acetylase OafA/YrhL
MPNSRNNLIDFLRIIAISGVFLIHYNDTNELYNQSNFYKSFIDHGKYGVTLFFVISGYVISKIAKSYNFLNFIASRFYRILIPGYVIIFIINPGDFISTSLNCFKLIENDQINFIPWFFTLSTEPHCLPNIAPGVQWTLAVELQFYLFFGLVLFYLIKNINTINNNYKIILITFMIFFIILVSKRQVYDSLVYGFGEEIYRYRNHLVVTHFEAFFLGIFVYLITITKIKSLSVFSTTSLIIIIFTISFYLFFRGEDIFSKPLIALASSIALLISVTDNFFSRSKILNNSFFGLIGRSTYVFYLIHIVVKEKIENILNYFFNENLIFYQKLILSYCILIILSVFLYSLIDKPIQKLWRMKFKF